MKSPVFDCFIEVYPIKPPLKRTVEPDLCFGAKVSQAWRDDGKTRERVNYFGHEHYGVDRTEARGKVEAEFSEWVQSQGGKVGSSH